MDEKRSVYASYPPVETGDEFILAVHPTFSPGIRAAVSRSEGSLHLETDLVYV